MAPIRPARCQRSQPPALRAPLRTGQSLIESCVVIILISFLLFGVLQISQLFAAQEALNYAATKAARAKTVGFNDFMVHKVVRVATIPNAGVMTSPDEPFSGPLEQNTIERARIPLYLGAENWGRLNPILNYSNWPSLRYDENSSSVGSMIESEVTQEYNLWAPFHRSYYAGDRVDMRGRAELMNHANLYLEDAGW